MNASLLLVLIAVIFTGLLLGMTVISFIRAVFSGD